MIIIRFLKIILELSTKKILFLILFIVFVLKSNWGQSIFDKYDNKWKEQAIATVVLDKNLPIGNDDMDYFNIALKQGEFMGSDFIDTIKTNNRIKRILQFNSTGRCIDSMVFNADTIIFHKRVFQSSNSLDFFEEYKKLKSYPMSNIRIEYVLLTNNGLIKEKVVYEPQIVGKFKTEKHFYNKDNIQIDSIKINSNIGEENIRFYHDRKSRLTKILYYKINTRGSIDYIIVAFPTYFGGKLQNVTYYYCATFVGTYGKYPYPSQDLIAKFELLEEYNYTSSKVDSILGKLTKSKPPSSIPIDRDKLVNLFSEKMKISEIAYCVLTDSSGLIAVKDYENDENWRKFMFDGMYLENGANYHLINRSNLNDSTFLLFLFEPYKRISFERNKNKLLIKTIEPKETDGWKFANTIEIEEIDIEKKRVVKFEELNEANETEKYEYIYSPKGMLSELIKRYSIGDSVVELPIEKNYFDRFGRVIKQFDIGYHDINWRTYNWKVTEYKDSSEIKIRELFYKIDFPNYFLSDSLEFYEKSKIGEVKYYYNDATKGIVSEIDLFENFGENDERILKKVIFEKNHLTFLALDKYGKLAEKVEHTFTSLKK